MSISYSWENADRIMKTALLNKSNAADIKSLAQETSLSKFILLNYLKLFFTS